MSETLTQAPLLVSTANGIKTLTFNLPEKKNPITPEMLELMREALAESKTDGTRVIVLTGAGEDFSAGADLTPGGKADPRNENVTKYLREHINPLILSMRESHIPIIAKVRGVAVGVGFSFALACDMIFASSTAAFSAIFTRIGLASDGGCAYFLSQAVGYHKAFELMARAAMIPAAEGQKYGFVNLVCEEAELDAIVQKTADYLASGPGIALQATKLNLREATTGTLASTLDAEAVNQFKCFQSQDFKEGVTAFLEKRKANFKSL